MYFQLQGSKGGQQKHGSRRATAAWFFASVGNEDNNRIVKQSAMSIRISAQQTLQVLIRCWCNVGPLSQTVAQHYTSIGSLRRVCWDFNSFDGERLIEIKPAFRRLLSQFLPDVYTILQALCFDLLATTLNILYTLIVCFISWTICHVINC